MLSVTDDTLNVGRETRFLIDNPFCHERLAYGLTKPLRMGQCFDNKNGVFAFIMQEVETTDDDNFELMIADYYKHFPRNNETGAPPDPPIHGGTDPNRRSWL